MIRILGLFVLALAIAGCGTKDIENYKVETKLGACSAGAAPVGTHDQRVECCRSCAEALTIAGDGAVQYLYGAAKARAASGIAALVFGPLLALAWRRVAAHPVRWVTGARFRASFLLLWIVLPTGAAFTSVGIGELYLARSGLRTLRGFVEAERTMHKLGLHAVPAGKEETSWSCAATLGAALGEQNVCSQRAVGFEGLREKLASVPAETQVTDWQRRADEGIVELRDGVLELQVNGSAKIYSASQLAESPIPETEQAIYDEIPLLRAAGLTPRFGYLGALHPLAWAAALSALNLALAWAGAVVPWLLRRARMNTELAKLDLPRTAIAEE